MPRRRSKPISLADLVDLIARIRADEDRDEAALAARDEEWIRALPANLSDSDRLLAWLDHAGRPQKAGLGVVTTAGAVSLLLFLLAAGAGAALCGALFHYDGNQPINILYPVALLAVLQFLLTLLFLLLWLTHPLWSGLGPAQSAREVFGLLNPGRLGLFLARFFPFSAKESILAFTQPGGVFRRVILPVQQALVIRWSQLFAVAFNIGVIATFAGLVASRDLAFGWSTTLEIPAAQATAWAQALATPWRPFLPGAVPTEELVTSTRFFRMTGFQESVNAKEWLPWWRFLLLSFLVYGLLPRVLTLLLANGHLARVIRGGFLHVPGAMDSMARLQDRSAAPEENGPAPPAGRLAPFRKASLDNRPAILFNWSRVPLGDAALKQCVATQLGVRIETCLAAGGARSPGEDRASIDSLQTLPADAIVIVAVKSWEPPLHDLADFLAEIRKTTAQREILVLLYGIDGANPSRQDAGTWAGYLAPHGVRTIPWEAPEAVHP